jgi:NAD(P)-dependent dehydrogenase (short-subunit alcohol dehydrogenase family)
VVIGLSESAAAEVDDYVIRILTICRGEIDTQMMSDAVNLRFSLCCKNNEMGKSGCCPKDF